MTIHYLIQWSLKYHVTRTWYVELNPFGVGINYDKEKLSLKWTSMVDVLSGQWF